jgi:hypothetical protein
MPQGQVRKRTALLLTKDKIERQVRDTIRKEDGIVFGAQAITAQIGFFARPTEDYDVFVKEPRRVTRKLEKKLDKIVGHDHFYTKKGLNPGTWKLKNNGPDLIKGTNDDGTTADFTKNPKPLPKTIIRNGIKFRVLEEEERIKKKIIKDPKFKFRKKKDSEDLNRIKFGKGFL